MYWKFLRTGGRALFTDFEWSTSRGWVEAGDPDLCHDGVHGCRVEDLPYWLSDELWQIELGGTVREGPAKVVAQRGRLLSRVTAWTTATAREFGAACIGQILEHAVSELRVTREDAGAELSAAHPDELSAVAKRIAASLQLPKERRAAKICLYLADAVDAPADYPVAVIAYIAARTAGTQTAATDRDGYRDERARQAEWLSRRLRLSG